MQPISFNHENTIDAVEVVFKDLLSGQTESYAARNLVVAIGGRPKLPEGISVEAGSAVGTGSLRGDTELKALLYKVFTGLASKTRKYRLCKGLRCFITR